MEAETGLDTEAVKKCVTWMSKKDFIEKTTEKDDDGNCSVAAKAIKKWLGIAAGICGLPQSLVAPTPLLICQRPPKRRDSEYENSHHVLGLTSGIANTGLAIVKANGTRYSLITAETLKCHTSYATTPG